MNQKMNAATTAVSSAETAPTSRLIFTEAAKGGVGATG
jgi:hypothetical protein